MRAFFPYLKNPLQAFSELGSPYFTACSGNPSESNWSARPASLQPCHAPCLWTHAIYRLLSYGWASRLSPKVCNDRQCCDGQPWAQTPSPCWECAFRAFFQKRNCGVKGTHVCSFARFCPIPHQHPTAMSESSCLPQAQQQNVLLNQCHRDGDES